MTTSDETEAFDAFFYCTYHHDLRGFSAAQAPRHYRRHGRREARPPNPSAMLNLLQAQEGALPPDFRSDGYIALNGDLRPQLSHSWEAAEHYLRHGRYHGRRYRAAPPASLTYRSSSELLRRRLVQAFGDAAMPESSVAQVHQAVRAARASATPAAALMDPILLARRFMSSSDAAGLDFARLDVQLKVLFETAFEPFSIVSRTALEMEVINRVRSLAITTELFDAGATRPPVTLLMLAVEAVSHGSFPDAPTCEQAAALVARFFVSEVPRRRLQKFVTAGQRARLRAPAVATDARPLCAVLVDEVRGGAAGEGPPDGGPGPSDPDTPFLDRDVWLSDMDYVMSSEQLEAAQIQVLAEGGRVQLCGPSFLFHDHLGVTDEVSWAAREAAQAWLQRFVSHEREDRGLPQTLVSASAAAYASGGARPAIPAGDGAPRGGGGRKRLRPGELLTFGAAGSGLRHLVGLNWHGAESAHVWTAAPTALIAINLDEGDVGPLDLFLRLWPGPRHTSQVSVWWNGCLMAILKPDQHGISTLHCHLGARHRSGPVPNILCLGVDPTFQAEGDARRLGMALYDLMLVPR